MLVSNRIKTLLSASVLAITAAVPAAGQADTPSVKFGQGELVSPTAARTYYAGVSNPGSTNSAIDASEPEITAMAAALNNDADLIFEYVHDKVAFVPLYGLQKGGLGALLDKSGNAFDQAQLLVEMLRAAGHTASYVMGDMTVTAAEFKNWFGVDNAVVACRLLADGGIPATISGANSTCGGLSGALNSNVTLSHVWVTATVNGQTKTYDPSFKNHEIVSPILSNLKTEMGYSTGAMLTTAGGSTSGNTAHSFNTTAINNSLNGLSSTLITKMNNANNYDESLDTLLGAEIIKPLQTLQDAGTFSGVDGGYVSNTTVSEIPNAYRTLVELDFSVIDQSGTSHVEFYGDQLYGRRLAFDWKANDSSVDNPSLAGGRLTLDDQFVATINTRVPGDTTNASLKIADGNATEVKFTVNHAYASNGGAYMDREYQRAVGGFSQSVTFVFGFGGTSDAVQGKVTSEHYRDTHYMVQGICETQGTITQNLEQSLREIKLIEHLKTQVGYGWLAQFSRATDLQARAVDAVAQHHHSFGMAYTSGSWADACQSATNPNAPELFSMTDSAIQIDMLSGLSVNHRNGSATERRATAQTMALAGATLEGSVFEQYAGKAHAASTTERFEWFNENSTSGQAFRIVDNSDWQTVNNSLPAAEKLSGNAWYQRYTSAGYIIIAPQGHELGPGAFGGSFPDFSAPSFERGSAFIAVKPDGSDVAHIVFTGLDGSKGGGAQQEDEEDGAFDPSKIADILKDQFEDRSKLHGVDLASGQVSYSPPADVTTGAGEFPYSLAFQRSYNTSGSRARGMGVGWTHNWDINASASGSATEAMGATRAVRSVPSLVAFTVMQDIFAGRSSNFAKDSDTLKRMVAATMVAHWWREHLQNNVVTVQQGANGIQFFKLPGEVFDGPTGSNAKLEYVGTSRRVLDYLPNDTCAQVQQNIDNGVCRTGYNYASVKYRYTSAEGDTILFNAGKDALGSTNGNIPQFLPDTWDFPTGVKIKFTHDTVGRVTKVQSNLGGNTATFDGPALQLTWTGESITSVTGTGLGSVQFAYADGGNDEGTESGTTAPGYVLVTPKNNVVLSGVTDLVGNTTTYSYMGNGLNAANVPANAMNDWLPRLYEIYTPEYTRAGADGLPTQRFTYNSQWRVTHFADGEAIRGERGTWAFNIAPGHRGQRVAPTVRDEAGNNVNPTYEVRYDVYGNAFKFTDEGGRITTATYDPINRVLERTFPSLVKSQFDYDTKSNVTSFTSVPSDGSASRVVTAAYNDSNWVTKPTSVTDARGNTTSISYNAPGTNGASLPSVATLPPVNGQTNQYTYAYNAFGQPTSMTDPEGMVTATTYDVEGFMASSIVDSGRIGLITSYTYDAAGNQLTVDGPRTDVVDITSTTYDALRRPLEQTNPVGTKSRTVYDFNSRNTRIEIRDESNNLVQVSGKSFNAVGQVYQTFSPDCYVGTALNTGRPDCAITTTTYNSLGRPDMVTDPEGRISQTLYYTSGDVAKVMRAVLTPLEQAYQTYTYVPQGTAGAGQAASVTDANDNMTEYKYDHFDQLSHTYFPSQTKGAAVANGSDYEQYIYDENGNQIAKRTRKADWIHNTYDVLNRVDSKKVYRAGNWHGTNRVVQGGTLENTVNYTYNLLGRDLVIDQLAGSQTLLPAHTITYTYDTAGRLDKADQNGRIVDVGYDPAGQRTSLSYPSQGSTGAKTVNFDYDAAGRMTTVVDGATTLATYSYDALSRKTGLSYLNGATSSYSYHHDSAIASIGQSFTNSTHNVSYQFGYNKANQVNQRTISNIAYVFDGFAPEGTTDYTSNGLNQYTETEAAPLLANGQPDPNPAPETVTATSYTYDANGNLTDTGRWNYFYDSENRLLQAIDSVDNVIVQFMYDGKGRRIGKRVDDNGDLTFDKEYEYLYEGDEPIQDYLKVSGTFVITNRYVHGASVDERLVHWQYDQSTGAETKEQFYHRDHQGSIVAMSNGSGARADGELYTYDAFGNQVTGATTGQPFRYTGRRYDAETGLYYYRARYYSSELGRFLQTDPIGYEDNMNMYAYTNNDPMNQNDPSGLAATISRSGNDVHIKTHIRFVGPGANPNTVRAIKYGIRTKWQGQKGDLNVRVTILDPQSDTPQELVNTITVEKYSPSATLGIYNHIDCTGCNTGTLYENSVDGKKDSVNGSRADDQQVAAHEFGHVIGLDDATTNFGFTVLPGMEGDIMNNTLNVGRTEVTEATVNRLLQIVGLSASDGTATVTGDPQAKGENPKVKTCVSTGSRIRHAC